MNNEIGIGDQGKEHGKQGAYKGFSLLFILCSLFLVTGCNNVFDNAHNAGGSVAAGSGFGRASIQLAGGEARTVFPAKIFDEYEYTFTKADGSASQVLEPDTENIFTLETGNWTVEVRAYIGEAIPANLAAIGVSDIFTVTENTNTLVVVVPGENVIGSGSGVFAYAVQYPPGAAAEIILARLPGFETVTLYPEDTDNGVITSAQTLDVPSGFYLFTVRLEKDGYYAGTSTAVHIYPLLQSSYSIAFTEEDFIRTVTPIDIAFPETGGAPAAEIAREQYAGTIAWHPNHSVFEAGTAYTAIITLIPGNGLTFEEIAPDFYYISYAQSVTFDPYAGTITVVFPKTGTSGLAFELIYGGTAYSVSKGDATDADVIIPVFYNGLPVTDIGSSAFNNFTSLTNITIPSSVTSIGDSAFYGCSGLSSVTIPSSVTSIDYYAFSNCSGLTSITVESGNTAYRSEGNCLIRIADNVLLAGCKNSIIPDGVASIGHSAFMGCSGLSSVTIPSSVTSIGDYAFYNCSGLTSITIPSSVTSIGDAAFMGCSGLTSVTIPSSVTSIGDAAFIYCSGLSSVTIPSSVTSIGHSAFYGCSGLTSVTIPEGVASIGNYAFYDCSKLNTVYYGGENNAAWSEITMGTENTYLTSSTVYYYSEADPGTAYMHWRFVDGKPAVWNTQMSATPGLSFTLISNNTAYSVSKGTATAPDVIIQSIYAGLPVTAIQSFENYYSLASITIPSSITSIGDYAFSGCSGLTSVTIPSSVKSIGNGAFQYCSGLTSVTIPSSVTSIGNGAFQYCSGLTSVTIPSSVTSIGRSAFYGCSSLTSVTIPFVGSSLIGSSNTNFGYIFGATSYSNQNSSIPSSLKTVIVTGGSSIGVSAFYGCSGLTSVTIPSSVTSIGNGAFQYCSGLSSITVDSGNTAYRSEGNCLIRNANNMLIAGLKNSIIPYSVASIGDYAFSGCSGLSSVTIPSSVASIGGSAFSGCSGLSRVYYGGADSAAWNEITIPSVNDVLINASRYYYSEIHPGTVNTHWRWVNGEPVIWE